jgi:hypothetical protein
MYGKYREGDCKEMWNKNKDGFPSNTKHALFFNEPEISGQADIAPDSWDAKDLWNTYWSTCQEKGLKCGSAAITTLDRGIPWLKTFEQSVGVAPDFMVLHWYGRGTPGGDSAVKKFQDHVGKFREAFPGRDIWITEYACHDHDALGPCGQQETEEFHHAAKGWMDSQDYIKRYAPFMGSPTGLVNGVDGSNNMMVESSPGSNDWMRLSSLGNFYAGN